MVYRVLNMFLYSELVSNCPSFRFLGTRSGFDGLEGGFRTGKSTGQQGQGAQTGRREEAVYCSRSEKVSRRLR